QPRNRDSTHPLAIIPARQAHIDILKKLHCTIVRPPKPGSLNHGKTHPAIQHVTTRCNILQPDSTNRILPCSHSDAPVTRLYISLGIGFFTVTQQQKNPCRYF
ncbi:MAG: hypothetical protein NC453_05380, partial [Muribaculum sp.]|nr:hypothetical protein [Muribaculum sp.]